MQNTEPRFDERYMSASDYVTSAMRFLNKDVKQEDEYLEAALGLAGEAGEIADILKKHKFQGHDLDTDKIIDELGDCLWYAALMCHTLGVTMEYIFFENITKLSKRYKGGKFSVEESVNRAEYEKMLNGKTALNELAGPYGLIAQIDMAESYPNNASTFGDFFAAASEE